MVPGARAAGRRVENLPSWAESEQGVEYKAGPIRRPSSGECSYLVGEPGCLRAKRRVGSRTKNWRWRVRRERIFLSAQAGMVVGLQ